MAFPFVARLRSLLRGLNSIRSGPRSRHALVGDPELTGMKRTFQSQFLIAHGLKPRHRLLDLGCGTLRGGIPLIAYLEAGHYCGVDVRAEVLTEARQELREAGLEAKAPVLLEAAAASAALGEARFDYIWAFSVWIHLPDAVLAETLALVKAHLALDAACYANVRLGERPDGVWQGMPIVTRPLSFYTAQARRVGLQLEPMGELMALGHNSGRPEQDRQVMLLLRHG